MYSDGRRHSDDAAVGNYFNPEHPMASEIRSIWATLGRQGCLPIAIKRSSRFHTNLDQFPSTDLENPNPSSRPQQDRLLTHPIFAFAQGRPSPTHYCHRRRGQANLLQRQYLVPPPNNNIVRTPQFHSYLKGFPDQRPFSVEVKPPYLHHNWLIGFQVLQNYQKHTLQVRRPRND